MMYGGSIPLQAFPQISGENNLKGGNMMSERIKELEEKLDKVCGIYDEDCSKCPYQKECDEYTHLYSNQYERHTAV